MKLVIKILAILAVVLAIDVTFLQWRKTKALDYLVQHAEAEEWYWFSHSLGSGAPSIPYWVPGVWPRSLAINSVPKDQARYAAAIRRLPRLDYIMIFVWEPMDSEVFAALGTVPDVRFLDLGSEIITDTTFERFTQFSTVESLQIDNSSITDKSMDHLLKFRKVRVLDFYHNSVSASQIGQLAQLPALEEVSLDEKLPPTTVLALHVSRPDLKINAGGVQFEPDKGAAP